MTAGDGGPEEAALSSFAAAVAEPSAEPSLSSDDWRPRDCSALVADSVVHGRYCCLS